MPVAYRNTEPPSTPGSLLAEGPLVVDLDGSLVRTDTTFECALALLRRPFLLCQTLLALRHGRARFKQELAITAVLDAAQLPYHRELLSFLREQQALGQVLVLATGADHRIADAVAQHLDLFDTVLASDGQVNLTGRAKLAAIREHVGPGPFTYIGNSAKDVAVWSAATSAICVNARPGVARAAARVTRVERSFAAPARLALLLRALRPYQWTKNLLVFVPIVTARAVADTAAWADALLLFAAFCLTASGIYLLNDLCDIAADRLHPGKSRRPFASGILPLQVGIVAAPLLLLIGFALGSTIHALPVLLCYAAVSIAYSLWLKTQPLIDVFVLAALYGLRLLAGGIVTGYLVSLWLLAFSSFLFLGLAMVKRVAELRALPSAEIGRAIGRGYRADDLAIIQLMGVASSFVASLLLALYVQSELPSAIDRRPTLAWIIVPLVLFWECRIWLATARGEMSDDPIVFAARDWLSWVIALCCFGVLLLGL
jgi:4-hydroxybenzoate polyprenyltransferase/phosphoserine phosphatase